MAALNVGRPPLAGLEANGHIGFSYPGSVADPAFVEAFRLGSASSSDPSGQSHHLHALAGSTVFAVPVAQARAAATTGNRESDAASRHINQPEHPPAFWEARLTGSGTGRPPQRSVAKCLERRERLVVVAPHPDDEVLMCCGLVLEQLRRGCEVLVIALTDGEACFGPYAERAAIGLERRGEALAGLRALGASSANVQYLGLPDGALALHESAVQQRLLDILRPQDLVVCTWRFDGHPDHDAAGRASAWACQQRSLSLLEAPVWMWHWARPDHSAIDWQALVQTPLSAAAQVRKWDALQCHSSQLSARGSQPPVVDAALQARVRWPFETFFETAAL